MDFALDDHHLALKAEAEEFAADAVARYGRFNDSWLCSFSRECSKELAARGWIGMTWPIEFGGGGRSPVDRLIVSEALITAGVPIGATWVADRQMGPGLFTFAVDILKGSLAVALTQNWLAAGLDPQAAAWLAAIAGMMAILGHSKPVWLGWKGGKSVATGLGLLLAMNLPVGLAGFGFFLLTLALFQIVSLGSIVAAASVIVMMLVSSPYLAYKLFAVVACGFIIWRHRSNIDRLRQGKEPKIGQKLEA